MRTLLLASAFLAGLFGSLAAAPTPEPAPSPYRPFCRTLWLFVSPCVEVRTALVVQIQALSQYELVSVNPVHIAANHTSPERPLGEDISFSLSPTVLTNGCRVTATSNSIGFASLLDGGLNYCNLRNLLSATGLSSRPGFMEMTNEWACLGIGLATCKV
ncbi:uncharacterized protein LOC144405534 [Gasterosteus aculeatus]|uniref:Uncharacterized protein n=1 Tax=Gasterosteus aculeatus aculeatus TaxID=481459 RepID=A0AAQ4PNP3_GASAC